MSEAHVVTSFLAAAESYINWVEGESDSSEEKAATALDLLAALYSSALQLMRIDVEGEEPNENSEAAIVSVDEWKEAYDRICNFPFTFYYEVDSLHESSCESHYTDLIEDLVDIYQDVKEGMNIYQMKQSSQALCHWQMTFEFHWGRHVLGAMKALHCYFQEKSDFQVFQKD